MSKQRVVIVTGGGSGIGKAIAYRFADNGDKVYILGRHKEILKKAASEIVAGNVFAIECDVTKPQQITAAVKAIMAKDKAIDVLINCAGAASRLRSEMPIEKARKAWDETIAVNLTGPFLMIYAVRPYLASPGGRIINLGSIAAISGSMQPGGQAYSAAKAGLHGLMRTLVKELAPEGITINTVNPGFIKDTGFFDPSVPMQERIQRVEKTIPARRVGTPVEIAEGVFYLASDGAAYVNGDILNINGGWQFSR